MLADAHAEMMSRLPEAIAYNRARQTHLIVENNGAIANGTTPWWRLCAVRSQQPASMSVGKYPAVQPGASGEPGILWR